MAINKKAKGILKEIKTLEDLLKEDLESWDPRTLPGKRSQHAQAKTRLGELKKEYTAFVLQNAAAIFVEGDAAKVVEFAKVAEENGGTITIDARGIYKALADEIFPTLRRNQVDFNHVGILRSKTQWLSESVGYFGPSFVSFTKLFDRTFTTEESLIDAIRAVVKTDLGDILQWNYIRKQIEDRAFASGTANSPVPCVIVNTGEDDRAVLTTYIFGDRFINVKAEGEIVPYTTTKAFNELKKKLKSNTENNEESQTTKEN